MSDVHSTEVRSYNMSRIRSKDTKPEETVRKYLFSRGLRYRKNDKRYPGHPDIVLPRFKTIIFVHGCFWHMHPGCKYAVMPSSNTEFWQKKLIGNRNRDDQVVKQLESDGWNVLIIWECELKKDKRDETLEHLYHQIVSAK